MTDGKMVKDVEGICCVPGSSSRGHVWTHSRDLKKGLSDLHLGNQKVLKKLAYHGSIASTTRSP